MSLSTDDGFALASIAVVFVAVVLAFGFGAPPDVVASVLFLGVMAAVVENKLCRR